MTGAYVEWMTDYLPYRAWYRGFEDLEERSRGPRPALTGCWPSRPPLESSTTSPSGAEDTLAPVQRHRLILQPLNEWPEPVFKCCRRTVAQQAASFVHIRPCLGNIAGLFRQPGDLGVNAHGPLQMSNHLQQAHGAVVAEVDHLVWCRLVLHSSPDAINDIIDVGVIPPGGAVTKQRKGLSPKHHARELMNGQIRALPRPVHRKETQGDEPYPIQMAVNVTHQLPAHLGAGIRTDGQ